MAAFAGADLLSLQGNIKRDPDGYQEEFALQYRHFLALLDLFKLKPSKESKEFGDLAMFMAQVIKCYPDEAASFASHVMGLLDTHYAQLDSALRRSLVQALILMRNRSQLDSLAVLPLFFRLFRCQDKQLRHLLFRHIVSDIKNSNKHARNDKLNRALQNFMYGVIGDDNEAAAKKSLAVCTELWRRHVWRDARTVNVIASAAFHKSSRLMLAVLKFFLGQDAADEAGSDGSGDEGGGGGRRDKDPEEQARAKMPTKQDVYNAMKKGTRSSKKKKQHKLARVVSTVKKAERKGQESHSESFAALHLLHDPQTFAEKLFSRLQAGNERFETRMAATQVISRVIGVHKLLVLNFYPYLQKYIAPHQRDVTVVLAALAMACHELVPPETLAPVLRQLVDQFVHDKARPEVMTIGLKTVRELCLRAPLVMTEELLQDLAMYRKFRDKEVSSAARGLIGLFRELNPAMLAKKDRGRGADLEAKPKAYGQVDVRDRVDGAELLEAAEAAGQASEDDDMRVSGSGSEDELSDLEEFGSDDEAGEEEEDEEAGPSGRSSGGGDGEAQAGASGRGRGAKAEGEDEEEGEEADGEGEEGSDDDLESLGSSDDEGAEPDSDAGEGEDDEAGTSGRGEDEEDEGEEEDEEEGSKGLGKRKRLAPKPKMDKKQGSLADLKRQLAELKARKAAKQAEGATAGSSGAKAGEGKDADGAAASASGGVSRASSQGPSVPIEAERILTEEDFARIKRLKQKALIEAAMSKHGLSSASSKSKRARLLEAAEAEAEEVAELQAARAKAHETRLDPDDLKGRHKRRKDKEERLASVLEGREGREKFGGAAGRKKNKTGGLTEKEKQKRKAMPIAARVRQVARRADKSRKLKKLNNFKGRVRG